MDSIPHTRLRSSSESSTASRASSASATSTTAITKNIPGVHEDSDSDLEDSDLAHLDALHDDNLADIPDDVLGSLVAPGKEPRPWKRLLLFIVPPIVVVVALSLSLGLYFGLRKHHETSDLLSGPEVNLGYSKYRGLTLDNGVSQFLGMRYAHPPLGDLRWRAPVAPENTTKTQSAQVWGSFCLGIYQKPHTLADEDCLYANVWSPANATSASRLPVVVFIQGGGYIINSNPYANGSQLVQNSGHNLVVVSLNYRVGAWGFMPGPAVKRDGVLNAGLLDQRFALHWVQKHIAQFGGDKDHVVIHGASAGAGSVSLQLAAYGGRDDGLFVGAIAESTFWPGQFAYDNVTYQYDRVVNATGCTDDPDGEMACLRGKSVEDVQEWNVDGPFEGRVGHPNFYWGPVTDGDFLRDTPYNMYSRGDFVKVPLLFGSNTNEGTIFTPNITDPYWFESFMHNQFPYMTDTDLLKMVHRYPVGAEPPFPTRADWFGPAARAIGDAMFTCPVSYVVESMHQALTNSSSSSSSTTTTTTTTTSSSSDSPPLFSYRFNLYDDVFVSSGRGVPHSFQAAAVFGAFHSSTSASFLSYNAPIIPIVQNYWISFIRSLDPNTYRYHEAPEWKPWGDTRQRLLLQLPNTTMEAVSSNETLHCDFWRSINATTDQ